ncbi:MAG: DUF4330 domain-containing protein [Halobacteria archaeon]|nr:DUF4330 domain-containing protein [Halobacteria archaeon]
MDIIDDEGRLFGVVNIVDALAVLLVLAVVVAGVAFVDPFSTQDKTTRYVTVDLDSQRSYTASLISEGDTMSLENSYGNLTVTDVYTTPSPKTDNVSVLARAKLDGLLVEDSQGQMVFEFGGSRIRVGDTIPIQTDEYGVEGTVTSVGQNGSTLDTQTYPVVATATVPSSLVENIEAGDSYTVSGQEVAVLESLQVHPGGQNQNTVYLGMTLETVSVGGDRLFAGRQTSVGASLPFETDSYSISPSITQTGTSEISTAMARVVTESTVPTQTAELVEVGDTYGVRGQEMATVKSVELYPTGNPDQRRLVTGLSLRSIERSGDTYFGNTRIEVDNTVTFSNGSYSFTGNIRSTGTTTISEDTTQKSIRVKLHNIPPETADSISVGMSEKVGGRTLAEVVDKEVEPAKITLTSDSGEIFKRQHPINKDVYLNLRVTVRDTETGLRFHGKPLRIGNDVVFEFENVDVNGRVTQIR